ncbi:MAG TPA: ABC transporter permease [Sedimentisphaerales bacterium]|nr:ABC transporter permease [Sedimentisphaerales bacterium]
MNLLPSLVLFARDLRTQKLRTFFALLGITWGTVAVVLLLAFGVGLKRYQSRRMHGMGDGIVIAWPMKTSLSFEGLPKGRPIRLRAEDVLKLASEIPELEAVSPELSLWDQPIIHGSRDDRTYVGGVYPCFGDLRHIYPQSGGRFINEQDIEQRHRVIFIGNGIKEELFGDAKAVGETLFIQGTGFVVIGVLKPKLQTSSYDSGPDERIAYIPASTMTSVFGKDYIKNFVYRARDPRKQSFVTQRVYQVLARICSFDPADTETLLLWDISEANKFIFYFFLGFNTLLGLCGVFTLLVGGIAVANIMYLLVGQKTGEIGIQIAVGAKRRHILAQFLLQALVLVIAGGMAGFLISWIVTTMMGIVPLPEQLGVPEMSPIVCFVTVVLLGGIGLLAGYFPARRAASLDPVRSLGFGGL